MNSRITKSNLEFLTERINMLTNSPCTSYHKLNDGTLIANIGNYHLDGAYGGWKLVRMCNEGGGIETVSETGYVSKKDLWNWMIAFIRGIEVGNNLRV